MKNDTIAPDDNSQEVINGGKKQNVLSSTNRNQSRGVPHLCTKSYRARTAKGYQSGQAVGDLRKRLSNVECITKKPQHAKRHLTCIRNDTILTFITKEMAPRLLKQTGSQTSERTADTMNTTRKSSNRQPKPSRKPSSGPAASWACYTPAYMKRNGEMIQRLKAELLEESRSPAARQIELVTEALTRYWNEHGTCEDEKREFRMALRQINELTETFDDETAEHLHLTLVKDWYRALYAHEWGSK